MVNYFKFDSFESGTSKKVIIILNLFMLMFSVIHWVYAWLASSVSNAWQSDIVYGSGSLISTYRAAEFKSVIAYYTITGIIQCISAFVVLGAAFGCFNETPRAKGTKILFFFLFLSFIFNFALAIVAAKDATYYYQRWDAFFNNDIGVYAFSNSYVVFALKYTKYTVAEAVLSFAISLPMLGAMIYGLLNPLINDNDHQMIHSKEQV